MGETILLIVVLLLALYGCTELIRWLAVRLLQPPVKDRSLRVLPVAGRRNDLDALVRAAEIQRRWSGLLLKAETLILVDAGLDEESRRRAEELCRKSDCAQIWDAAKLEASLSDSCWVNGAPCDR